jgi:hypothetical protein
VNKQQKRQKRKEKRLLQSGSKSKQEQKDIAEGKIVEADKSNKKVQPMVKTAGTGIKAE